MSSMVICQATAVMEGFSVGKLLVYDRNNPEITNNGIEDVESEWQRYLNARNLAIEELEDLYQTAISKLGHSAASIFYIQKMVALDVHYNDSIENHIKNNKHNAAFAVAKVSDNMCLIFKMLDSSYMRERAADVRDVSDRIINNLIGGVGNIVNSNEPIILVSDDLQPSETAQLAKSRIVSFVTINGSANSHTAIIAKTMGMPALINAELEITPALNGRYAIVDGYHNCLYIDPTEEIIQAVNARNAQDCQERNQLRELKGKKTVKFGKSIQLFANINSLDDIEIALANDADGIGLFRSEFFFTSKNRFPTEHEQFDLYKKLLLKMNGKPVTIRTIDVGADKNAEYLRIPQEKNPALGLRGIRFSLNRKDIFVTQLRALIRASVFGKLRIMFPMITSVSEIDKILAIIAEVENELYDKKIDVADFEIGVMIETPASVIISDLLAAKVDFLSVGTNDLTQYSLAIDRENPLVAPYFDPTHIAIKRMLDIVAISARANGISVGVCGELAAEYSMTDFFIKHGFHSLSIVPGSILKLKQHILA